jgi:8-oxo-dGTP pyrophosphatase MutT (NUDIX family)
MELVTEPCEGPIRPAASLVMLRDGANGLEVLLLKRHARSEVLGGVHVFPGGKVDAQDAQAELHGRLDLPAGALRSRLAEPALDERAAAALHVAALRETFEETGVLYAPGVDAASAARAWQRLRQGRRFGALLAQMALRLAASRLQPWSRWITPAVGGVVRKRFDTRFFLAPMPAGQLARHDEREAVESLWLTPQTALRRYWERSIELAPPQIMSLAHLARQGCVADALAQAQGRPPPLIEPEPFEQDGVHMLCYPGDERHPVCERKLPGPTRLRFRNRRFEPVEGLDGLLA